jgi:hypothetical protein
VTENQIKFLELAREYELVKDRLDLVREELNSVLSKLELNSYFQDPTTKAVYKVVKPKGTFVSYKDVDYHRTALEGERQGSLSKKEAQEQNFTM